MKKIFLFFSLTLTFIVAYSQTPQGITFQAVARDPSGNAARLRQINIIDRILVGSGTNGVVAWEEKHVTTTNAEGVFTIIIGKGTKQSGTAPTFNDIKWDQGVYFFNLRVSVFPSIPTPGWNPDANYIDMGSSQFWSVPYALFSGNVSTGIISIANGGTGSSTQNFVDLSTTQTIAGNKTFTGNLTGATIRKSGGTATQFLKADGTVDTVQYAPIFSPKFTGIISGITKSMVGLGNVNNTNDEDKPVSNPMKDSLNLKENLTNKSSNVNLGLSDLLYPTQKAVKKYVDSAIVLSTPDASETVKGKILLAGDLRGTADLPTVPGLSLKAPLASPTFTGTVRGITKSMVGLGNVDNTSDSLKPISTAAQAAMDLKAPLASPTFTGTVGGITKSMVGLGNVDNTSDALKPISAAAQAALDLKAPLASPTFTGTVGGITKSMVGLGNVDNTSDALKPISIPAQAALDLKAPLASPTFTGTVGGITKSMVGLGNVDNTSDALKPVSTAVEAALDLKAPLASPTFTGTVGGITKSMVGLGNVDNTSDALKPISTAAQAALDLKEILFNKSININTDGTSDTKYPSVKSVKTYVDLAVSSGISGVPDATPLIKGKIKIAGDLGGTADVPTVPGLSLKAPLESPTFTGTVGGITKSMVGLGNVDNTSDVSKPISTAAQAALDLKAPLASPTFTGTVGGITKSMVGLGNVDNTSDALKPVSTAAQAALDLKASLASPTFTGTVGGITKSMVGLGNVDNTSDALKPVSTATQTALDLKAPINNPTFTGTVGGITKSMVGLGNVDNTSDALKPISTAAQSALDLKEALTNKSININTDAASDAKYPSVKSVKTYVDLAVASGVSGVPDATDLIKGKIKISGDLGGTADLPTVPGLTLKAPINNPTFTGTVGGITKSMVGLGNVDNTSDALKPVSTAAQTALDLKAPINNPTFTGTVGGITKSMVGLGNVDNTSDALKPVSTAAQTALDLKESLTNKSISINTDGTSDTKYPSVKSVKDYVDLAVASGVSGVPDATSLIKGKIKIAGDLGGTADLPTVPGLLLKANLASPALTGTPTAPTAIFGTNSTQIATTAYADAATPDATSSIKGKIVLAGDLTGTASSPSIANGAITTSKLLDGSVTDGKIAGVSGSKVSGNIVGSAANVTGIVAVANGGTGASNVLGAKASLGLENVNNTSDALKPISTATQTALDLKASLASPTFTGTVGGITKSMVGLGNVDNTSDVLKPVSTAAQAALDLKAPLASPTFTGTVNGITKSMVGLGNVDNTSDALKPISDAAQSALDLKEALTNKSININTDGTSDTKYPSVKSVKTYVDLAVASGVSGVPDATTLIKGKIKVAGDLGGTADLPTVPGLLLKADLASPALTGTPTAPTASFGSNSTQIATTAYADAATPDATAVVRGKIVLAGDFAGTALSPSIANGAIITSKLSDGSVTDGKIAGVSGSKVSGNIAGSAANVTGIVAVANGGTGASTVIGAKASLGLENVNNTSDALKPISTATQSALDLKEASINKSINITTDAASDVMYPSVKSVKTYVDAAVASGVSGVPDASTTVRGKVKLAGDLGGTADLPTVPQLVNKVNYSDTALMLSNRIGRDTASLSLRINNKMSYSDTASLSLRINEKMGYADTALMLSNRIARDTASLSLRINNKMSYSDTASLSLRINEKMGYADTALMLSNRIARDTASLSLRINNKMSYSDTASLSLRINEKMGYADTALMLSNRIARDTASLSLRINNKMSYSDTALMLSNRIARDTASLSLRINEKMGYADTALMLSNRIGRDTASLSLRINEKMGYADTALMLSNRIGRDTASLSLRINEKLSYADTALMLSNRIGRDTASLSLRINEKLNYSDTALMLSNRIGRDTASLSLRINEKLNYSDTALMLSNRIARDTAFLSARINERVNAIGTIDVSSNAKGASITGGVLSLAPADATNGGIVTTGDQTFEGIKTFNQPIIGSIGTPSDLRLKRNVNPILGAVETVMQLNPVSYEKKISLISSDYSIKENGFIAQELKKILPISVNEGKGQDKLLSVNYISIIPVLTKAIQEQQKTIEGQQKQIDELKMLVEKLLNKK